MLVSVESISQRVDIHCRNHAGANAAIYAAQSYPEVGEAECSDVLKLLAGLGVDMGVETAKGWNAITP